MSLHRLPVTIVSGFLGAGKTTLVNHLLAGRPNERIGIIVNEFGEVSIDGQLIVADENPLIEISNGCICCTVRKDLSAAVIELLARSDMPLDRLVIETSGLADPAPVLQTFLADPAIIDRVSIKSVIAVVDARHVGRHLGDEIVREQIAFADTLVLNKIELLDGAELAPLERELRRLNPAAALLKTSHAQVDANALFDTPRFSLDNVLAIEPDLLADSEHDHEHDASITSVSATASGPLDPVRFERWINQLVLRDGATLMRTKGVLDIHGEARRFHVHSVHMLLDSRPGRRWQVDEPRMSRMVFIGRNLEAEALRAGFAECQGRRMSAAVIPA